MATYVQVKNAVVSVVDDFTDDDVEQNYGTSGKKLYSAKTKLMDLYINEPMRASMVYRFNKVMTALVGPSWKTVGAYDMVAKKTIGDLIKMACARSSTTIPSGEPT